MAKKESYRIITLEDIINAVKKAPKRFPLGMKTPVMSGDFEGNYTHRKHEVQYMKTKTLGNVVCLGYEMHEGGWDEGEV